MLLKSNRNQIFALGSCILFLAVSAFAVAQTGPSQSVDAKNSADKQIDLKPIKFSFPRLNLHVPALHLHLPKMKFKQLGKEIQIGRINLDIPKLDVDMKDIHVNIPRIHVKVPSVKVDPATTKN